MAETSLDDFFAKKDKSKKKSKSKIKPEDILVQGDKPKKVKKKKSANKEAENDVEEKKVQEDEEWKDYIEEEAVDYTGLRIKEMQLVKDEEEQEEEEGGEDEGEGRERKEGGPWNKIDAGENSPMPERIPTPEPKPKPKPEAEAKPAVGKYIPPSRRGESGGAAVASAPQTRRKKKEAPNLHSEHDFPTLGGADYTQGGQFEEVRSGGRQTEDPSKQRLNLQLDNKFGALEGEDS